LKSNLEIGLDSHKITNEKKTVLPPIRAVY